MSFEYLTSYIRRHDLLGIQRLIVRIGNFFRPNAKHTPGQSNLRKVIRLSYAADKSNADLNNQDMNKLAKIAFGIGDLPTNLPTNSTLMSELMDNQDRRLTELRSHYNISHIYHFIKFLNTKMRISATFLDYLINLQHEPLFTPDYLKETLNNLPIINEQIVTAITHSKFYYPINETVKKIKECKVASPIIELAFKQRDIVCALKAVAILAKRTLINEYTEESEVLPLLQNAHAEELAHSAHFRLR